MRVKLKQLILLAGDITLLYGALFLTLLIRYSEITGPLLEAHLWPFTIVFALWLIVFYIIGFYELTELKNTGAFGRKFALALAINAAAAIAFFYFIPAFGIAPKTNLFIFLIIFGSAAYAWRTTSNRLLHIATAGERLAIIGSNKTADELVKHLERYPQLGFETVLWLKGGLKDKEINRLAELIEKTGARTIVVEAAVKRSPLSAQLIYRNLGLGVAVADLANVYETVFKKVPLAETEETRLAQDLTKRRSFYDAVKPPLERFLAAALGLILLPLTAVIALTIKIDSPGSAFFTQVRIGKSGRPFILWKFRTMRPDAEKKGPQWARPNDKRVTKIGRILRGTHLDELPQLWNIMRGELSLVGPRPERPEFVRVLRGVIPLYDLRHLSTPGLTGWAQINYRYGASPKDAYAKLEYDIYYLKNRSLLLDLLILLKTAERFFVPAK